MLEARDRVGGRVEAKTNGLGETVDTGGQFICDDMPEVMALAKKHGKTLVESNFDGNYVAQPVMSAGEAERAYDRARLALRERMNGIAPDDPEIAGRHRRSVAPAAGRAGGREGRIPLHDRGLWCSASTCCRSGT